MDAIQGTASNGDNSSRNSTHRYVIIVLSLFPFIYLGICGLYLHSQWDNIAIRIPVHYDLSSNVDGWADKGFWGIYGLLFVGFVLEVLLAIASYVTFVLPSKHTEPLEKFRFERARVKGSLLLLGNMHWIALWFCGISIRRALFSHLPHDSFLMMGLTAVLVTLIFLPLYFFWLRPEKPLHADGDEEGSGQEYSPHWKFDMFYWNPDDPSLIVERRYGYGVTLNMARPSVWALMVLITLLVTGPVILLVVFASGMK